MEARESGLQLSDNPYLHYKDEPDPSRRSQLRNYCDRWTKGWKAAKEAAQRKTMQRATKNKGGDRELGD